MGKTILKRTIKFNGFHEAQMTSEGLMNLQREYDELANEKRPKLVERLSNARAAGDLSENNDYISAREELEFLDGRIAELENILQKAVVVQKKSSKGTIGVGTQVTVQVNSTKHVYYIVGEWEADPMQKKISHESPIGRALLGKRVGDSVEVEAPAGKIVYKILAIE